MKAKESKKSDKKDKIKENSEILKLDFKKINFDFPENKENKEQIKQGEEKEAIQQEEINFQENEEIEEGKESEEDFSEPMTMQRFSNGFSFSGSGSRAPVLEQINISGNENLETEISQTPISTAPQASTTSSTINGEVKEITYVQNAPKYTAADYAARSYDNFDEDDFETRAPMRDIQTDISQGRIIHRAISPVLEQNNEVNLGLWQRENVFRQDAMGMGGGGSSSQGRPERDYQITRAKKKKDEDRLPFQQ
jgi:hypothetical protein